MIWGSHSLRHYQGVEAASVARAAMQRSLVHALRILMTRVAASMPRMSRMLDIRSRSALLISARPMVTSARFVRQSFSPFSPISVYLRARACVGCMFLLCLGDSRGEKKARNKMGRTMFITQDCGLRRDNTNKKHHQQQKQQQLCNININITLTSHFLAWSPRAYSSGVLPIRSSDTPKAWSSAKIS